MKKHFYSHIVHLDDIYYELDGLDLKKDEKHHLTLIVNSTVHHTVIDTVLSELHEDDKKIFLDHLHKDRHNDLYDMVRHSVADVEYKILLAIEDLKKSLLEEIKKHKK